QRLPSKQRDQAQIAQARRPYQTESGATAQAATRQRPADERQHVDGMNPDKVRCTQVATFGAPAHDWQAGTAVTGRHTDAVRARRNRQPGLRAHVRGQLLRRIHIVMRKPRLMPTSEISRPRRSAQPKTESAMRWRRSRIAATRPATHAITIVLPMMLNSVESS